MEIWQLILTAIGGGGVFGIIQWLYVRKANKRKEEAAADREQNEAGKVGADTAVIIGDAYKDILERYKSDNAALYNSYNEIKIRFDTLEKEVQSLRQNINTITPLICGVQNCPNRKKLD